MSDIIRKIFMSEIKAMEGDQPVVQALVSTDEVDRYQEVVLPTSFKKHLKKYRMNPVILWAHSHHAFPIGKCEKVKVVDHGLEMQIRFAVKENPDAQIVYDLMKGGYLNAFSIGFAPIKYTDGATDKEPRRTYEEVELLETSVVPVPAASGALVQAREAGIIPEEKWENFESVDEDNLVKSLESESLLPEEDETLIHVPMLRHSEYDSSTRRAFLYHAEEAIQAVLCKTKDDQWAVCKYIFNKVRRWNRETAKEMAEKIDQERILKNLDLFDLEKPAEMLPAGMDF
jgi:HK97 family phage prohead protease